MKKEFKKDEWDAKEIFFLGRFGRDELEQLQPWRKRVEKEIRVNKDSTGQLDLTYCPYEKSRGKKRSNFHLSLLWICFFNGILGYERRVSLYKGYQWTSPADNWVSSFAFLLYSRMSITLGKNPNVKMLILRNLLIGSKIN